MRLPRRSRCWSWKTSRTRARSCGSNWSSAASASSKRRTANLQIIYGGTGEVRLRGNATFSAVVYAPKSQTTFTGQGDFYGAIVTQRVNATGGAAVHYDRALDKSGYTIGNPVMSAFTWKSF